MQEREIADAIKAGGKVILYSKQHCGNCDRAAAAFDSLGITFVTVKFEDDQETVLAKARAIKNMAMPFLEVNEVLYTTSETMKIIEELKK